MSSFIIKITPNNKIVDAEKLQEIEKLLIESFKAFAESERQKRISDELGEKAITLILSENVNIDNLLIQIKKKVLEDGS